MAVQAVFRLQFRTIRAFDFRKDGGPIPKNNNVEFAEDFKKFIKFTESVLDSGCTAQIDHLLPMFIYTSYYFSNLLLSI